MQQRLTLGTQNVTSLMGKELELALEVQQFGVFGLFGDP